MNILITGGIGFVGRAFIRKLGTTNRITSVDIKPPAMNTNTLTFIQQDCRDYFKRTTETFDLVIHLAAIVGGRQTIEGDPISVATDLSIDAEMFNWAVKTKQPRVVYFSSSAAYPVSLQEGAYQLKESDIDLSHIANPDLTYGWAKLTGEMLADFARKQGVNVHVFRPFSGYGEDQDLDYPFPSFIKRVKDKVEAFEIWGDGNQVRDFIHIDDIVNAVMEAVDLDIQEPINLGWGRATSFNELARMIMQIAGHEAPVSYRGEKPVGVSYRCSDNSKLLTFYQPEITLEDGILRALNHEN